MKFIQPKATASVVAFLLLTFHFIVLSEDNVIATDNIVETESSISEKVVNDDQQVKERKHSLYLSLGDEFDAPLSEPIEIFGCSDKVFAVIELENHPLGNHQLSVRWYDPNGTVRENTQYDFRARESSTRLWAWLSLSRGFGGGMLQWLDPAAGLEEFIGVWKVEVKIDGKSIDKKTFEVSC